MMIAQGNRDDQPIIFYNCNLLINNQSGYYLNKKI